MSLAVLLRKRYYELIVKIKQDRAAKLPYYGPLVRGWLGDALYTDKTLYSVLFKNPSIDVRPFFFCTAKERDEIRLNMRFMGFSVHFVKGLVVPYHFGDHKKTKYPKTEFLLPLALLFSWEKKMSVYESSIERCHKLEAWFVDIYPDKSKMAIDLSTQNG